MIKIYILIGLLMGSLIFMWCNSHKIESVGGLGLAEILLNKQDSLIQKYTIQIQDLKKDTLISDLLKKPAHKIITVSFLDTIVIEKIAIEYALDTVENLLDSNLIQVPKNIRYVDSALTLIGTINKTNFSLDTLNINTSINLTSSIVKTKWFNYYLIYAELSNRSIHYKNITPFSFKEENKKKKFLDKSINFGIGFLSGFLLSKIKK